MWTWGETSSAILPTTGLHTALARYFIHKVIYMRRHHSVGPGAGSTESSWSTGYHVCSQCRLPFIFPWAQISLSSPWCLIRSSRALGDFQHATFKGSFSTLPVGFQVPLGTQNETISAHKKRGIYTFQSLYCNRIPTVIL